MQRVTSKRTGWKGAIVAIGVEPIYTTVKVRNRTGEFVDLGIVKGITWVWHCNDCGSEYEGQFGCPQCKKRKEQSVAHPIYSLPPSFVKLMEQAYDKAEKRKEQSVAAASCVGNGGLRLEAWFGDKKVNLTGMEAIYVKAPNGMYFRLTGTEVPNDLELVGLHSDTLGKASTIQEAICKLPAKKEQSIICGNCGERQWGALHCSACAYHCCVECGTWVSTTYDNGHCYLCAHPEQRCHSCKKFAKNGSGKFCPTCEAAELQSLTCPTCTKAFEVTKAMWRQANGVLIYCSSVCWMNRKEGGITMQKEQSSPSCYANGAPAQVIGYTNVKKSKCTCDLWKGCTCGEFAKEQAAKKEQSV